MKTNLGANRFEHSGTLRLHSGLAPFPREPQQLLHIYCRDSITLIESSAARRPDTHFFWRRPGSFCHLRNVRARDV
jgi:hypothetical protein